MVFWIDQNTFATALLEKVFKQKNLPFYTLVSVKDFSYLVDDLKPELIVLDVKTALEGLETFKAQYELSDTLKNIPIILIDDHSELPFIKNVIGKITRPFDPFRMPELLNNLLKAN